MFDELFEKIKNVRFTNTKEGKVDYDALRTEIMIMLNDPFTSEGKIFRVLGKKYPVQTIKLVLDRMKGSPKNLGPLEW